MEYIEPFKDILELDKFDVSETLINDSKSTMMSLNQGSKNGAVAPAKSPIWRCGASQIAKWTIFYLDNLNDIAWSEVHDVFTKKVKNFYSLPGH